MNIVLRRRKLGNTSCREIAAKSNGLISVVRNDARVPQNSVVFRWGVTSNVPETSTVINSAKAIHLVADKKGFRKSLADAGLAPKFYGSIEEFLAADNNNPIVVRPARHSQGRHTYLCNSLWKLRSALINCGSNYYISEFVDKVAEFRVFVYQGKVVWVAEKTPGNPQDVAWNVARGGRFDNVRWKDWKAPIIKAALEAMRLSKLDFGGVDIMEGPEGTAYVLEINSAPSQTSEYRQSCVAKAFVHSIQNNTLKQFFEEDVSRKGYGRFIHTGVET